jgi:prephenate dehydrogenase
MKAAAENVRHGRFVGGHPMAGKESRGVQEADADLFLGRPYVLTAHEPELEKWIGRIGARVVILSAPEHDRLVALTSHLPQLISTALAVSIAKEPAAAGVTGPAALYFTRLALSSYDIWRDILATNSGPIDNALAAFIEKLEEFRKVLCAPSMEGEFDKGATAARRLREIK